MQWVANNIWEPWNPLSLPFTGNLHRGWTSMCTDFHSAIEVQNPSLPSVLEQLAYQGLCQRPPISDMRWYIHPPSFLVHLLSLVSPDMAQSQTSLRDLELHLYEWGQSWPPRSRQGLDLGSPYASIYDYSTRSVDIVTNSHSLDTRLVFRFSPGRDLWAPRYSFQNRQNLFLFSKCITVYNCISFRPLVVAPSTRIVHGHLSLRCLFSL